MSAYSLSHLPDAVLLRDLKTLVARDRTTTAELLAHIAEVDDRRLYAPVGHPSMFSYCVHELGLSEDAAFKRIRAARTARQFPAIFPAVADGRLHLSAVVLLGSYLTRENADELLAAATHRSKAGIEQLLAERFQRPDLPALVQALAPPLSPPVPVGQLAPGPVAPHAPGEPRPSLGTAEQHAPGRAEAPVPPTKVAPLSPQRYALQVTIGQSTHEKLRYARELLGHQLPSGELAEVLDRALEALIEKLERRKLAATPRPRRTGRPGTHPRHIPAPVRRAVWERDGGQCTFVSEAGRRCPARSLLEFDHVEEVARGGRATVAGIRLRCRAHNQYGAECTFGAGFMHEKREQARQAAAERRERRAAEARRQEAEARPVAAERARAAAEEVIPFLRKLGCRVDEARHAAAACESIPEASLEERVRVALASYARQRHGLAARAQPMAM